MSGDPTTRTRWLQVALGLALAALAFARVVPSFQGWHHEDDVHAMRWVMEHRDTPWQALTGLHSLHDHVRPATLIATWAGAMLSDGAWWGPHLVHVSLVLLALAGLGVLVARVGRSTWAGLLAVALAVPMPGVGQIPWWNAWVCSAGELAAGLWGLVVFTRRPWAGVLLLVLAGLFKEPGWLIYPAAAVLLAGWRLGGLSALMGLGGLALTWNPTNVYRYQAAPVPIAQRLADYLGGTVGGLVDRWPLGASDPTGLALPAALVGYLMVGGGVPGVVAGLVLWTLPPVWGGLLLIGLLGLALARRVGGPLPVIALVSIAVMAPFQDTNAVQVLPAAVALAGLVALLLVRQPRKLLPVLLVVAALPAGRLLSGGARLGGREPMTEDLLRRDALLGTAALGRAMDARVIGTDGPLDDILLAPLFGLAIRDDDPPRAIELPGSIWLDGDPGRVMGDPLPTLPRRRAGARPKVRPGGRGARPSSGGLAVERPAGLYAVLSQAAPGVQPGDTLIVISDACEHTWRLTQPTNPVVGVAGVTVQLAEGCGPLRLARATGTPETAASLVALPPVLPSLSGAKVTRVRIDVKRSADGVAPGMFLGE